ncbi:MAG: cytochrome-c peroxidase [Bacteroidia bacterium]
MRYYWIAGLCALMMLAVACEPDDTPEPCPECPPEWVVDNTPYKLTAYPSHFGNEATFDFFIPDDNPLTIAKVNLGKKLFYDSLLSRDYTVSCSSCHHPDKAFSDPRAISLGVEGRPGTRNAPGLMNVLFGKSFFWDGNTATLEEQALIPIEADFEMDNTVEEVVRRLNADTAYQRLFGVAFGKAPDADGIAKALSSFERILITANTPYDQYVLTRNINVLSREAQRGLALFFDERADCFHCHVTPSIFTDEDFADNGLEFLNGDTGRDLVTGNPDDRGKFKTPTLRNLAFTGPYMHDGRFETLEEVIEHYVSGGANRPTQSPFVRPNVQDSLLTDQEKSDLIAFLLALTDSSYNNNPEYMP